MCSSGGEGWSAIFRISDGIAGLLFRWRAGHQLAAQMVSADGDLDLLVAVPPGRFTRLASASCPRHPTSVLAATGCGLLILASGCGTPNANPTVGSSSSSTAIISNAAAAPPTALIASALQGMVAGRSTESLISSAGQSTAPMSTPTATSGHPTAITVTVTSPTSPRPPALTTTTNSSTASTTKTTSSSQSPESFWSAQPDKVGGTLAPAFPTKLANWHLTASWDATVRAFDTTWSNIPGSDGGIFPSTMNGCDEQLFLVRWRALEKGPIIDAQWIDDTNKPGGKVASGNAGWFILDSCETPALRYDDKSPQGGTWLTSRFRCSSTGHRLDQEQRRVVRNRPTHWAIRRAHFFPVHQPWLDGMSNHRVGGDGPRPRCA